MLIRFSKKERDYVLNQEKVEFYDDELERLNKKLEDVDVVEDEEKEQLEKDIKVFTAEADKKKAHLEKYGPTVWKIKSASKEAMSRLLLKIKGVKFSSTDISEGEVSTNIMEYARIKAITIIKLGLVGWSNLRDEDGNEAPFSRDLVDAVIDNMPESDLMELANEISGEVKREDEKN